MPEPVQVIVPLLNPNEPEARLAALHVREGDAVKFGTRICTLETTKSTVELTADRPGHVAGLTAEVGAMLPAGARLCWLVDRADWKPPEVADARPPLRTSLPEGLRITEPALALAKRERLDLGELPADILVTEAVVRQALDRPKAEQGAAGQRPFRAGDLVLYGGGGHGKSLIDLIRAQGGYEVVGIIDDGLEPGRRVMGVPVLGGSESLEALVENGLRLAVNAVGGVGDVTSRIRVFRRILEAGLECPSVVHPTAVVEPSARLSEGVQVFPHAYVGSEASIGFGAIVNTGAVVSHDCVLGDYVNVSPGSLLAGGVEVGEGCLVGMGVTINLSVRIGPGSRVGNSAVVKQDVPANTIVQAGSIWPVDGSVQPS